MLNMNKISPRYAISIILFSGLMVSAGYMWAHLSCVHRSGEGRVEVSRSIKLMQALNITSALSLIQKNRYKEVESFLADDLNDIMQTVRMSTQLIELSGGECAIVAKIHEISREIEFEHVGEANGTENISVIESLKCPGS